MPTVRPPTPNATDQLKPLPPLPRTAAPAGVNTAPPGRPSGPSSPTAPVSAGAALLPQMPAPYVPPPMPTAPPPTPLSPGSRPSAPVGPAPAQAPPGPAPTVAGDPWTDQSLRGDPWTDVHTPVRAPFEQTYSYVPSAAELDALPPGATAVTPWGPVQRGADGKHEVVMDDNGKAQYGQAVARAKASFGPMPSQLASLPGLPPPPVVPGRANFNPWINLWS